jgi:hypothetical protein
VGFVSRRVSAAIRQRLPNGNAASRERQDPPRRLYQDTYHLVKALAACGSAGATTGELASPLYRQKSLNRVDDNSV